MTTAELVHKLLELDPKGTCEVVRWQDEGDGVVEIETVQLAYYYDGRFVTKSRKPYNAVELT